MHTAPTSLKFKPAALRGRFFGFGFWYLTGISGQETGEAA